MRDIGKSLKSHKEVAELMAADGKQQPSKLECKPAADFPSSPVTGPEQGLSNTEPSLKPVVHLFPRYEIHGGWPTVFLFKCKLVVVR